MKSKKILFSTLTIMSLSMLLGLVGCKNNSDTTSSTSTESDQSKNYAQFESNLNDLGNDFTNIVLSLYDENVDKINEESKNLQDNTKIAEAKLAKSNASDSYKNDMSQLLNSYNEFSDAMLAGNYNVSDISNDVGTLNRQIADTYYNGELPNSLQTFSEKTEQKEAELEKQKQEKANKIYGKGEYWEVPNQWKLTVNSITPTDDRNQFSDKTPAQVVVVDYTYENLGYTSDIQDLFIMPDNIIDSSGQMGDLYPASVSGPKPTPVGATMPNAQDAFGLVTPNGNVKVNFSLFDSNHQKQTATFELPIE